MIADVFLKKIIVMDMNHGVQQRRLTLWKKGKNTEIYVTILNTN